jgi:hypothetical protein
MIYTIGAGAASRYGSGSGSDQKMRLLAAPAPQHCFQYRYWVLIFSIHHRPPVYFCLFVCFFRFSVRSFTVNYRMAAELGELNFIFQNENQSIYSRDSSCRAVWSIPDFNLMMKSNKEFHEPQFRFSSRLSGLPPVVSCWISCRPRVRHRNGYYVQIKVALHPHSGSSIPGRLEVSIGVLNVDGLAHIWETFVDASTSSHQEDRVFTAYKSVSDLTRRETDYLKPDGSLTILVNLRCLDWGPDSSPITAASQIDNLFDVMLVDKFVDVGRGSILLVFQDGEQLCHTFPIEARNSTV